MIRCRIAGGLLALGCLAAACGGGANATPSTTVPPGPTQPPTAEQLELGRAVYDDTCSVCHGRKGEGIIGPSLNDIAGRMSRDEHVERVRDGAGTMPAFSGTLTDEEIEAVVAFERSGWDLLEE